MSEQDDEITKLRAENAALRGAGPRPITYKVGEKGGVSVYGLGRFPITLYQEQWVKLFDHKDAIVAFITENESKLKRKT
jgi:hypothetical protein